MKKNRYMEEQIVSILREAELSTMKATARKHGVAEQTLYRRRKRFSDMKKSDVRELKRLRDENARLKKLVAERDLVVEEMTAFSLCHHRSSRAYDEPKYSLIQSAPSVQLLLMRYNGPNAAST